MYQTQDIWWLNHCFQLVNFFVLQNRPSRQVRTPRVRILLGARGILG